MSSVSDHVFYIRAKEMEKQHFESAIEEATNYRKTVYLNVTTQILCTKAFKKFKNKIETMFPDKIYSNKVHLILEASEKLFFYDLNEKIRKILETKQDLFPK